METHPFLAALAEGRVSRDVVRRYAASLATVASGFPDRIARVLAICPEPEVRRSLLGNLLEEEGVVRYVAGHPLDVRDDRNHSVMARRFARAAGATDADLQPAGNSRWFTQALAANDWLGAFAYFAIGFEANVPATFRLVNATLQRHYGMGEHDLEFIIEHMSADERHGVESAELIERIATSEDAKARALEGARRGGAAWWALHRSFLPALR
jgi:pyrroloquinoline quinone (PQQ) biosynthesis protein C